MDPHSSNLCCSRSKSTYWPSGVHSPFQSVQLSSPYKLDLSHGCGVGAFFPVLFAETSKLFPEGTCTLSPPPAALLVGACLREARSGEAAWSPGLGAGGGQGALTRRSWAGRSAAVVLGEHLRTTCLSGVLASGFWTWVLLGFLAWTKWQTHGAHRPHHSY